MTEIDRAPSPEELLDEELLMEAADRLTERSEVLQALEAEWIVAARLISAYKNLFSDAENLEVLNLIAGPLLRLTHDVLWEYLLLRVARLTDPPAAGRQQEKENLSVLGLPLLFGRDEIEDQQKARLEVLAEEAKKAAKFARQWRNQLVAHVDLKRARDGVTRFLGDKRPAVAEPLEPATLEKMDRALEAVHRTLDTALQYHYHHYGRESMGAIRPGAVKLEIGTTVAGRAIRLIEAVQFIDALVDPEREGPRGVETASEAPANSDTEPR